MLEAAGLGVGFLPKEAVEPACDEVVGDFAQLRALFEDEGLL
jgi:phosphoserine phosphatase